MKQHLLFGKGGFLGQLRRCRPAALRVLDADDEAALLLDTEIFLDFPKF
jgi:hypothetical protein